ncbi:hypothetical protein EMIHUDRAFT_366214 [Emiliania huxleyi CCMP1516]|uniref:Uncharacterized protein n=2 Tax=Emiliania huxleyi TaxID=2903 RepID=A0A0D3JXP3_EMIH1|nr:hypothetical protein EMIHUDRAFT_366214 [Emiliania huxleyi CCMP1516]EOD28278.1 hypothetical protein EMIHUDRAFT_366214 [Emiliania huxleyi CCMP1516]|eukprot:XP_005780707.1 hypothetical protein EMIHUDRAFT_366214 [Emiliania huxleyi CCMP1516]
MVDASAAHREEERRHSHESLELLLAGGHAKPCRAASYGVLWYFPKCAGSPRKRDPPLAPARHPAPSLSMPRAAATSSGSCASEPP